MKKSFKSFLILESLFCLLLLSSLYFLDRGHVPNMPPVFLYIESDDAFQLSRQIIGDFQKTFAQQGNNTAERDQQKFKSKKSGMKMQLEGSETSYWQSLDADPSAIGIRIGIDKKQHSKESKLRLSFSSTNHLSKPIVEMLVLGIQGAYLAIEENPYGEVIAISPRQNATTSIENPEKLLILPIYITFNIIFAGLWLGFFFEFESALASKHRWRSLFTWPISMTSLLVLMGLVVAIGLMGNVFNLLILSIAMAMITFMMVLIGVFTGVIFRHKPIGKVWIFVVQCLQLLPLISYFLPSFNNWWLKILPSYSLLGLFKGILQNQIGLQDFGAAFLGVFLLGMVLFLGGFLWQHAKLKAWLVALSAAAVCSVLLFIPSSHLNLINMAVVVGQSTDQLDRQVGALIPGQSTDLITELQTLGNVTIVADRDHLNQMIDRSDDVVGIDTTRIPPQIIVEGDEVMMPQLLVRGALDRYFSNGRQLLMIDYLPRSKQGGKTPSIGTGFLRMPLVAGTLISLVVMLLRGFIYIGLPDYLRISLLSKFR